MAGGVVGGKPTGAVSGEWSERIEEWWPKDVVEWSECLVEWWPKEVVEWSESLVEWWRKR